MLPPTVADCYADGGGVFPRTVTHLPQDCAGARGSMETSRLSFNRQAPSEKYKLDRHFPPSFPLLVSSPHTLQNIEECLCPPAEYPYTSGPPQPLNAPSNGYPKFGSCILASSSLGEFNFKP